MSDTTPALDEAFERMAAASFELPNGFVNHAAMACEALAVLDCTDDIDSWARRFAQVTQENVGRPFAIVLDNKVISAPVIREPILQGSGQISGSFTVQAANDLAILLRAGALPAPLTIVEERTVGPGLGQDSIEKGKIAS